MIDYEQNVELIKKAIIDEHPGTALENLVLDLSKNGESKKDIYQFFFDFYQTEQETKEYLHIERANGEHPVELIMDRLSGYCGDHAELLRDEDNI